MSRAIIFLLGGCFTIGICTGMASLWCWHNRIFNGDSPILRALAIKEASIAYLFLSFLVAGLLGGPHPSQSWVALILVGQALAVKTAVAVWWVAFLFNSRERKDV